MPRTAHSQRPASAAASRIDACSCAMCSQPPRITANIQLMRKRAHTRTNTHAGAPTHVRIHQHSNTHTQTQTHTRTHTHTHARTHAHNTDTPRRGPRSRSARTAGPTPRAQPHLKAPVSGLVSSVVLHQRGCVTPATYRGQRPKRRRRRRRACGRRAGLAPRPHALQQWETPHVWARKLTTRNRGRTARSPASSASSSFAPSPEASTAAAVEASSAASRAPRLWHRAARHCQRREHAHAGRRKALPARALGSAPSRPPPCAAPPRARRSGCARAPARPRGPAAA
jgi:hypothetical protein